MQVKLVVNMDVAVVLHAEVARKVEQAVHRDYKRRHRNGSLSKGRWL